MKPALSGFGKPYRVEFGTSQWPGKVCSTETVANILHPPLLAEKEFP